MVSIGERLRNARLEQGLSLAEIVARTRIGAGYLDAIETGDFKRLPGVFFYKSFIRQYARTLGFEEGQFATEIAKVLENEGEPKVPGQGLDPYVQDVPPLWGHSYSGHRLFRTFAIFFMMVAACSSFYAWWHKTEIATVTPAPMAQETQPPAAPA